jgi:hypothetical protein
MPLADDIELANDLLAAVVGQSLVQFRMSFGVQLELGPDHVLTIETPFSVVNKNGSWSGEALTGDAAAALLPLVFEDVASAAILADGTFSLGFAEGLVSIAPHPMYESWQVTGPSGMLIVCPPSADYISVWTPDAT